MLRHCTIQEILDVRDGQGTVAARAHLDECEHCRRELERAHQRVAALKALPTLRPPRDRWPATRDLVVKERRANVWIRSAWLSLAAAAVLLLAVGTDGAFRAGADSAEDVAAAAAAAELQTLVRQAAELEVALGSVGSQIRRVDGLTALTIAGLEDQIALVSSRIETSRGAAVSQRELTDLWRERVALMDALVNTHVKQVSSVGF